MRKILTYILILTFLLACTKNKKSEETNKSDLNTEIKIPKRIAYVMKPAARDSLCKSDISKAKEDIKNGKLAYIQTFGFDLGFKRYESDLKQLCKEKGLEYRLDLIGCVVKEGQTQGCYGAYMDKTLSDQFGSDFKENLNRKADSLFLVRAIKNEIPIYSGNCDEKPKPILENQDYLETTLDVPNLNLKRNELDKTWPAIDLSFIIERDGKISKFYSNNYIFNLKHNKKFKKQLYTISVDYVKSNYPNWKSGIIRGTPVRTDHNLRLTFIGK